MTLQPCRSFQIQVHLFICWFVIKFGPLNTDCYTPGAGQRYMAIGGKTRKNRPQSQKFCYISKVRSWKKMSSDLFSDSISPFFRTQYCRPQECRLRQMPRNYVFIQVFTFVRHRTNCWKLYHYPFDNHRSSMQMYKVHSRFIYGPSISLTCLKIDYLNHNYLNLVYIFVAHIGKHFSSNKTGKTFYQPMWLFVLIMQCNIGFMTDNKIKNHVQIKRNRRVSQTR